MREGTAAEGGAAVVLRENFVREECLRKEPGRELGGAGPCMISHGVTSGSIASGRGWKRSR